MVNEQVDKVKNIKRKELLLTNKKNNTESHSSVDYIQQILKIITKNWNILEISSTLQKVFDKKPIITYKRIKNLGELIGGHTLQGGKAFKTHLQIIKGESKSCNKQMNHLYAVHK